ncbi:sensor histidine kinase [Mangrovibrevibacter kandeliae]|uniref:sensor histidine kinase n=1 Tax=Mangrovibrevibacter kandeliae TaxID=2968473 RepID=UPI002117A331|nr:MULTISPECIES: response regulator [unclassified Aurantimonas]MCQ8781299.1 response regulator [Aurantimonas sp. CSK15Z-1]MCW4114081.1 response regulator [Aurantimonas sp. MSK8Z-1]
MSNPPRVLYIDDDEGLRTLAERALTRRNFTVTTAADGIEGVARAAAERFDLIVVDHYMPGQDGLETLARLRALPDPPPVIYVTGSEESRVAVAALKAGAADYVVKVIGDDFFNLLETAFGQALERVQLRRAKREAEEALRASNAHLEALLREVNHRVANSLQLVLAFVQMQSNSLTDQAARAALADTQRRITAIAQVHRKLYAGSDVASVDMADYLSSLVRELEDTWSTPGSPRTLRLLVDPIRLKTDKAVSLGVIVNELVSNACKYAYDTPAGGEVRVSLCRDGEEHFVLRVEDDGAGFATNVQARGTGLGAKLVRAMASSLRTEVAYEHAAGGVKVSLRAAV